MTTFPTPPDLAHLAPAARAALEARYPAYLAASNAERERLRCATDTASRLHDIVVRACMRHALNKDDATIAAFLVGQGTSEGRPDLEDAEYNTLNRWLLPVQGLGADLFWLNEGMPDDRLLCDFATIGDYDVANHAFQARLMREDETCSVEAADLYSTYRGDLFGAWARYIRNDRLVYASLFDWPGYVLDALDGAQIDIIDGLCPNELVPGPDHMRPEPTRPGSLIFDMHVDAGGKEALHATLQRAAQTYIRQRVDALRATPCPPQAGRVWIAERDPDGPGAVSETVVFADIETMQAVRLDRFLSDCADRAGDADVARAARAAEVEAFRGHLTAVAADAEAAPDTHRP